MTSTTADRELYFATVRGDLDAFERALASGARPTFRDEYTGETALHAAAGRGQLRMVELLLAHDADPNAPLVGSQTTPLGSAVYGGHLAAVELLLKAGAEVDVSFDRTQWTALHAAVSHGHPEIVACLLANGADVRAKTGGGMDALAIAVQEGHDRDQAALAGTMIKQLRTAGASPATSEGTGESAIELAKKLGRDHLLSFLS